MIFHLKFTNLLYTIYNIKVLDDISINIYDLQLFLVYIHENLDLNSIQI